MHPISNMPDEAKDKDICLNFTTAEASGSKSATHKVGLEHRYPHASCSADMSPRSLSANRQDR
jgi:hypothetical protein